jgi:hypothetical protein
MQRSIKTFWNNYLSLFRIIQRDLMLTVWWKTFKYLANSKKLFDGDKFQIRAKDLGVSEGGISGGGF